MSGMRSREVVDLFKSAPEAIALSDSSDPEEITAASALKMAYAGFSKGSSALLLAVNASRKAAYWRRCTKNGKFRLRGWSEGVSIPRSISRKLRFGAEMDFISKALMKKICLPNFTNCERPIQGSGIQGSLPQNNFAVRALSRMDC